jgi:hypothetical protein
MMHTPWMVRTHKKPLTTTHDDSSDDDHVGEESPKPLFTTFLFFNHALRITKDSIYAHGGHHNSYVMTIINLRQVILV